MPAVAMLAVAAPAPAQPAADAPPAAETVRALIPVGPPEVHAGVVRKGEVVLRVPVTHGLTGRLQNEVKAKGVFITGTPAALQPGQAVYGIPLYGGHILWCAPRAEGSDGLRRWSTVCLTEPVRGMSRWLPVSPPMFVKDLMFTQAHGATPPVVKVEPVDFGVPMTLVYRFEFWDHGRAYLLTSVETDQGRAEGGIPLLVPQLRDGRSVLPMLGGGLLFTRPVDDRSTDVSVALPLTGQTPLPF